LTRAPKLDLPLTLEAATIERDGGGGETAFWTPVCVLWGAIKPVSAREAVFGGALVGSVTHRVQTRRIPRDSVCWPGPSHRLRLRDRLFNIEGVTEASDILLTLWVCETVEP
jgi:head-tail adaptor